MIHSTPAATQADYDPFVRGPYPVGECTLQATESARNRVFPCEIWYPDVAPGSYPLIVFSHHSGGHRRAATHLTTHLARHGYVVGALDHSR